jgi:hypothetical protein
MPHALPENAIECPKCREWTMRDRCPRCGRALKGVASVVQEPPRKAVNAPTVVVEEKARAKPRMPKMRKSELRWLSEVAPLHFPTHAIISQGFKLPLQDGGTYTADYFAVPVNGRSTIIEVKGLYRGPGWEQGIERYRRARYQWEKYFNFEMWETFGKGKKWEVER